MPADGPVPDPLGRVATLPPVAAAADAARAAVDRLLTHRLLRRRSAEISAEAGLRSARASAALEGVDIPLPELREHGSGHPVVQGALRTSLEIAALRDVFGRAPFHALARLHVLAAADLAPSERLGRPRLPGEVPVTPPGFDGYVAGGEESSARLDGLMRLLAGPTGAPAVVVSAVVHGELLALQPFPEANGLVARAAARLVLTARGLDPKALTAPDVGHLEQVDEYREALRAYAQGTPEGVARWVAHCCSAVELGARESLAVCEALTRG